MFHQYLYQTHSALVGVVTNKLDQAFAFENQPHNKYTMFHTTGPAFCW